MKTLGIIFVTALLASPLLVAAYLLGEALLTGCVNYEC